MRIPLRKCHPVGLSVITLVAIMGCEGAEGPVGPVGPQGAQGEEGPQGPVGTANVVYSDWTAFDAANWDPATSIGGQTRREYPVAVSHLTDVVLSSGTVAAYVRFDTVADRVFALPLILPLTSSSEQQLAFELELNTLFFTLHDVENNDVEPTIFGAIAQFRYVIIPGGTPAKSGLPDFNNYHEVMAFYGLNP